MGVNNQSARIHRFVPDLTLHQLEGDDTVHPRNRHTICVRRRSLRNSYGSENNVQMKRESQTFKLPETCNIHEAQRRPFILRIDRYDGIWGGCVLAFIVHLRRNKEVASARVFWACRSHAKNSRRDRSNPVLHRGRD